MSDQTELDEKLARFADRTAARKPEQDAADALAEENRVEGLRQSYLNRTGRTGLDPELPIPRKK